MGELVGVGEAAILHHRPQGGQAEIELLKGALKHAPRPRGANTSVVTGPMARVSHADTFLSFEHRTTAQVDRADASGLHDLRNDGGERPGHGRSRKMLPGGAPPSRCAC